jgi:acetylornithine deacetylase/succinyl-diaminopimelate desuccinylase-like protein
MLQRLVRFNTVNPPGNEEPTQRWLREQLEAAGFDCELLEATPGRPNLVARLGSGSDGPTLCLLGHVDTVLADATEWSVDPWSAELRDG